VLALSKKVRGRNSARSKSKRDNERLPVKIEWIFVFPFTANTFRLKMVPQQWSVI
jgi:hypothetical protein